MGEFVWFQNFEHNRKHYIGGFDYLDQLYRKYPAQGSTYLNFVRKTCLLKLCPIYLTHDKKESELTDR